MSLPPTSTRDRLRDPLPFRADGKRFRDVSLVEQHEILFRFLEEIFDDLAEIKASLAELRK